ncbi:hypothetical protein N9908_00390 [Akkermansiaceae bacterium]|nr:hypothetical protein [Akkermansiaceae bacterium]
MLKITLEPILGTRDREPDVAIAETRLETIPHSLTESDETLLHRGGENVAGLHRIRTAHDEEFFKLGILHALEIPAQFLELLPKKTKVPLGHIWHHGDGATELLVKISGKKNSLKKSAPLGLGMPLRVRPGVPSLGMDLRKHQRSVTDIPMDEIFAAVAIWAPSKKSRLIEDGFGDSLLGNVVHRGLYLLHQLSNEAHLEHRAIARGSFAKVDMIDNEKPDHRCFQPDDDPRRAFSEQRDQKPHA